MHMKEPFQPRVAPFCSLENNLWKSCLSPSIVNSVQKKQNISTILAVFLEWALRVSRTSQQKQANKICTTNKLLKIHWTQHLDSDAVKVRWTWLKSPDWIDIQVILNSSTSVQCFSLTAWWQILTYKISAFFTSVTGKHVAQEHSNNKLTFRANLHQGLMCLTSELLKRCLQPHWFLHSTLLLWTLDSPRAENAISDFHLCTHSGGSCLQSITTEYFWGFYYEGLYHRKYGTG